MSQLPDSPQNLNAKVVRAGEGATMVFGKERTIPCLSPEETGGQFTIDHVETEPGGGPPLHVHTQEDEVWMILDGEFEFRIGRDTQRVGAGDLVFGPRNTPHAFRCVGEKNGKFFVLATGDNFAKFFPKWMAAMGSSPPDVESGMKACAEHGMQILERPQH